MRDKRPFLFSNTNIRGVLCTRNNLTLTIKKGQKNNAKKIFFYNKLTFALSHGYKVNASLFRFVMFQTSKLVTSQIEGDF